MYELERLVEGVPFEVLNQQRDSVRIGPCLAPVVAGSESVGVVSLIDKGAVGLDEFLYRRPETAGKRGEDGFVDDPLLGGVIGIIVDCHKVIEGFDQFGFRLGGVEVGRCRRYGLRPLCFLLLSLSGTALGRSLFRSRLRDGSDRSCYLQLNRGAVWRLSPSAPELNAKIFCNEVADFAFKSRSKCGRDCSTN
jgi:hypothetical protein